MTCWELVDLLPKLSKAMWPCCFYSTTEICHFKDHWSIVTTGHFLNARNTHTLARHAINELFTISTAASASQCSTTLCPSHVWILFWLIQDDRESREWGRGCRLRVCVVLTAERQRHAAIHLLTSYYRILLDFQWKWLLHYVCVFTRNIISSVFSQYILHQSITIIK